MKRFYEQQGICYPSKYAVSFHDGVKKHRDGSDFFDIRLFRNKRVKDRFVRSLMASGYKESRT